MQFSRLIGPNVHKILEVPSQNGEKLLLASSCVSFLPSFCLSVYLSVCLSVFLSAWNDSAPNVQTIMKFLCLSVFYISVVNIQVPSKFDENNGHFT